MKNILKLCIPVVLTGIILLCSCKPRFEEEILVSEIEEHIAFLASDSLKGRYPGTREDGILAGYITGQMKRAGLTPYKKTGLQNFRVVTSISAGDNNSFIYEGISYLHIEDFQPMPFSSNSTVSGEVVFAGYGFQFQNDSLSWDDYNDISAGGKIIMILKGNPEPGNMNSAYMNYSEDRGKVLLASDMGAAGVIFVSGSQFDADDRLTALGGKEHQADIPAVHIKRYLADSILRKAGLPRVDELEQKINSTNSPASFHTGQKVYISTDINPEHVEAFNTISVLKGAEPSMRNQYVVVGAHHDHLGMGGEGSGSRKPDTTAVHYGADDNASGVAAVLEISEKLAAASPKRSMIFATFGAEEMGLIGSRYFVEKMPFEAESIQAMINLDMVGRLNEDRLLQISGVGTSPVFEKILDSINNHYGFNLKISYEGYGPSDHAAFYAKDIPVIFISTGAHTDYHTPGDSYDKINYTGAVEVFSFVADIAGTLANYPLKILFTEAGPKVRISSQGRYGKITLGIMPDMNYDGNDGMPVLFVTEGRPAAAGGMKKGDVIVAIEGKRVGNIYDYMSRLGQLEEGQSIIVTVKRDEDTLELLVKL